MGAMHFRMHGLTKFESIHKVKVHCTKPRVCSEDELTECAVSVLLRRSAIGNPIPLGAWDGQGGGGGGGAGVDRAQQCYQIAILYRTIYLNIVFKYC